MHVKMIVHYSQSITLINYIKSCWSYHNCSQ